MTVFLKGIFRCMFNPQSNTPSKTSPREIKFAVSYEVLATSDESITECSRVLQLKDENV